MRMNFFAAFLLSLTAMPATFLSNSAFADSPFTVDSAPNCYLFDNHGNTTLLKRLADTPPSQDLKDQMKLADSLPIAKLSYKYSLDGVSVELTQSAGCAMECWSKRHILVTAKGLTFLATGSKEGLGDQYPEIEMNLDGKLVGIQCDIPPAK